MAQDYFGTFLDTMNKLHERDLTMQQLSGIFDEVAKAADKTADADAKTALKVAAAQGKEKIEKLKRLL